ncbi:MAG: META domain-containing protein [Desulfofustis sp.]|nr:META domain-containing protein [Desulfofustis sp.]
MKAFLPLLIAGCAMLLGGCAADTVVEPDSAHTAGSEVRDVPANRPLHGVNWQLIELDGNHFGAAAGTKVPYLLFSLELKLSGYGGCNPIAGTYLVRDDILRLKRTPAQRIACPRGLTIEDRLLLVLDAVEMFRISDEGILELIDHAQTVRARFASAP